MQNKIAILSASLLMAGALVAQKAPASPPSAPPGSTAVQGHPGRSWQGSMVRRLTQRLNLTADQQMRVKAIVKEAREQNQPMAAQLRDERMALRNAVKTDSLAQIDQITQSNAALNAKVEANHVKTMAKIYAILTPDQKAAFDHEFAHGRGVRQSKGV